MNESEHILLQSLRHSVKMGDVLQTVLLSSRLKDIDVCHESLFGLNILSYIAQHNRVDMVYALLYAGANIDAGDSDGRNALHMAVSFRQFDVINVLLEQGANINILTPKTKRTVLYTALLREDWETAKLLVRKGINLNVQDSRGWTVLHYASYMDALPMVEFFLQHGADKTLKTSQDCLPLDLSRSIEVSNLL